MMRMGMICMRMGGEAGISKVIAMKKMRLMHLNRVREKDGGSKRRSRLEY